MKSLNENIFHQYNKWKTGYVRKENDVKIRMQTFIEEHHIKNYSIITDKKKGIKYLNVYDPLNTIRIHDEDLVNGKLPFKFGEISDGLMFLDCETLISLEGAPKKIDKFINIQNCPNLTSLKGAPQEGVSMILLINCGKLVSLEGLPKIIDGRFSIRECSSLKTLKGAPKFDMDDLLFTIPNRGEFVCSACKSLTSLEGAPDEVMSFDCCGCVGLTSLKGGPSTVYGEYNCWGCVNLTSLDGLPKEVHTLYLDNCSQLTSLEGIGVIKKKLSVRNCGKPFNQHEINYALKDSYDYNVEVLK